jgi:hypothetical protein
MRFPERSTPSNTSCAVDSAPKGVVARSVESMGSGMSILSSCHIFRYFSNQLYGWQSEGTIALAQRQLTGWYKIFA